MFPIGFSWTRLSSSMNIKHSNEIMPVKLYTATVKAAIKIIMTRSSPTPQGRSQLGHEIVKAELQALSPHLYKLTDGDIVEAI